MDSRKRNEKSFFRKYRLEILICLFCLSLAMFWQSRKLISNSNLGKYVEVNWDKEMLEVMCDTNAESISYDENFAWLYVWLGSLDAKENIYDQVILEDDGSLTMVVSKLQILDFKGVLKRKLDEIVADYTKEFDRDVDISADYDIISLSTESDYEYRLDDDYELRLIRLYVLALQSLSRVESKNPWSLTINIRDKNTMEILQRINLPGNIERESEVEKSDKKKD